MGDQVGAMGAELRRSIRISSRSGRVDVIAEPRDGVVATKGGRHVAVDEAGNLSVLSRTSALEVRVPEGSDVVVGTISGRITLKGRFGAVAANSVSARISVEAAERVDARSVSGRVDIGACTGEVRIDAVSGRAEVASAGSVLVSTASGRISVDEVKGKVRARAVSGRITITVTEAPLDVKIQTASGRVTLAAPADATPLQELHTKRGSVASELAHGDDGQLTVYTHSGSVRVIGER